MGLKPIRAFAYFGSARGRLVRIGLLSLVGAQCETAALVLVVPLAKAVAAGDAQFAGSLGPFAVHISTGLLAVLSAAAIVLAALSNIWLAWSTAKMTSQWELLQRNQIVDQYLAADYPTQARERLGTLDRLSNWITMGATTLGVIAAGIKAALNLLLFVGVAIILDARAAVAIVVFGALLSAMLRPAINRSRKYSRALAGRQTEYSQDLIELTRLAREVTVFSAAVRIRNRLARMAGSIASTRRRAAFVSGVTAPAYQYGGLLLLVMILAAARGLSSVNVTALGAIALLLLRSVSFGQQVQGSYQRVVETMPFLEKLEELRADYVEGKKKDGTVTLEAVQTVELEGVHYRYQQDGEEALAGITLGLRVGEIVGVVGASGSGKTTLSQLLLRLRDPTTGSMRMNGIDASEYSLASFYRHVALVPQEPRLLHGTITENIAFFDDTIDRAEIEEAARGAGIHDVIESLDDGYDTLVGPAFRDLSGGQIQRLGIARALVRQAEVLVLDEPTSALDVHSEAVIQATVEGLRGRALVVIIAHRLSTLSICDRIVVLHQGQLETVGTLPDVAERSPFFRRALEAGTLDIGLADSRIRARADDA